MVAAETGLSVATVSRVMNNSPRVTEATRQRVLEASGRLGYLPNPAARALATAKESDDTNSVVEAFLTRKDGADQLAIRLPFGARLLAAVLPDKALAAGHGLAVSFIELAGC